MPLLGFVLGYVMTLIPFLGLTRRVSRTIAAEVALQNATVAAAVIQGSFAGRLLLLGQMVVFPLLYYVFQVGYSLIFVGIYKALKIYVSCYWQYFKLFVLIFKKIYQF